MNARTSRRRSRRYLLLLAASLLGAAPCASAAPATAGALHELCVSPSWSSYMNCQGYLHARALAAGRCVPEGTSAARLQLGFRRYVEAGAPAADASAELAAAGYLEKAFGCQGRNPG